MMRIVRVVPTLLAVACSTAAAEAQTPAAAPVESRVYAEFNGGASLGHTSDTSIAGEGGVRLMPNLDVFAEGGHIGNAATGTLDDKATKIANSLGATASVGARVNFFDAGARYHWPATPLVEPYIMVGFGLARVRNSTAFAVNGTVVDAETLGVQFGTDLRGSRTKPFLVIGGGATVGFARRYFVDLGYRYGRVFKDTDESGNVIVPAINTQRVQAGIGVRF